MVEINTSFDENVSLGWQNPSILFITSSSNPAAAIKMKQINLLDFRLPEFLLNKPNGFRNITAEMTVSYILL